MADFSPSGIIDDVDKLRWTLDNIYTIARREANRVSPHPKWAHVLRLCEAVGCQPRGVLRASGEDTEETHGRP